jgi:hypothetical protein
MQCKDIPDRPIVQFIADLQGNWGTWFSWIDDATGDLVIPENSVVKAMPNGAGLPDKLVLAKIARLMKRGLIDGCPCGCRGDYELTSKGREFIATTF